MYVLARLLPLATAALISTACVVHTHDAHQPGPGPGPEPDPVVVNYSPMVLEAEAGVFWDGWYHDDIWYFEGVVDDPDGPYDVVQVWADVYDEFSGQYIDSFELYPTDDPYYWYTEVFGSSTWLDPYYGGYTVDIIAYDSYDDYDWMTVWAWTY